MGYIGIRVDDKSDALIRNNATKMGMNLSDYLRYKLNVSGKSSTDQIILSFIQELRQQKVELVEMRKELRIAIGAMIETLKPFNVTTNEMKKSGIEFFKKDGDIN